MASRAPSRHVRRYVGGLQVSSQLRVAAEDGSARTERQLVHVGRVAGQDERQTLDLAVVRDGEREVLVEHRPCAMQS